MVQYNKILERIVKEEMEFLEKLLKKTGWTSLLTSLLFAIIGVVLITNPDGTIKLVSNVLGILFIVIGIYKILRYFIAKGKYELYNYDIAYGVIAMIIGMVTIVYSTQIVSMFRIVIGIWILYSSVMRLTFCLKLKKLDSYAGMSGLVIALLMLICGLFIIFNEGAILVTIGSAILIYSILDMIESGIFIKNVNKMM